jgi:ribosomal protein S18 acetylase RimI-like enzyme
MSEPVVDILEAREEGDDLAFIRTLFVEYAETLSFHTCFEAFDKELESLPGSYARPAGNIWIARVDGAIAGCVALRAHEDGAAEMKRLYVRPGFRGHRLGSRLTKTVLRYAKANNYSAVRLDTMVDRMREAQALYGQLGFQKRDAYYDNPPNDIIFYERDLTNLNI